MVLNGLSTMGHGHVCRPATSRPADNCDPPGARYSWGELGLALLPLRVVLPRTNE